jgi:ribosome-associated translation inhibitor RaiA
MQYKLKLTGISITKRERDILSNRISLNLSRFTSLISNCDIRLIRVQNTESAFTVICEIKMLLQAGFEIEIEDSADTLESAVAQALERCKRAIQRHLKHHRSTRLGSSTTTRT